MPKIRLEVSTAGIDEALQNVSPQVWTGLRIPPVLASNALPSTQPRYLFTLCSVTFSEGIKLIGLRQGLTIGMDANEGTAPERPIEQFVRTPTFKFPDGNVVWHLRLERQPQRVVQTPPTDTQSWKFLQSDSPAMLYKTATFSAGNFDPATGAPLFYNVGLTAYTAPSIEQFEGVAGLGTFYDLRFPWQDSSSWRSFADGPDGGIDIPGGGRLSFYATVQQTNPATRVQPTKTMTTLSSSNLPEEAFIQDYQINAGGGIANALGPIFWRVMGSMIVEKDI